MAEKNIPDLDEDTTPVAADEMEIYKNGVAQNRRVSLSNLITDYSQTPLRFQKGLALGSNAVVDDDLFYGSSNLPHVFYIDHTTTDVSKVWQFAASLVLRSNPATTMPYTVYGAEGVAYTASGNAQNFTAAISLAPLVGTAGHAGTGTVAGGAGLVPQVENKSTGIITNAFGIYIPNTINDGGGTVTNAFGAYLISQTRAASNNVAVEIQPPALDNGIAGTYKSVGIHIPTYSAGMGNQSATTVDAHGILIGQTTYSSTTNTRTITNATSLYIEGAPVAGSNVTITNGPFSLWVDSGRVRFDGDLYMEYSGATTSTEEAIVVSMDHTGSTTPFQIGIDIANVVSGGTATAGIGMLIQDITGAGTVTNAYGVYVTRQTKGSAINFDLYTEGGTSFEMMGLRERSSDPSNPAEGEAVFWQSNGTGSGDDGDIMVKITAGAVTKTATLLDFSTL